MSHLLGVCSVLFVTSYDKETLSIIPPLISVTHTRHASLAGVLLYSTKVYHQLMSEIVRLVNGIDSYLCLYIDGHTKTNTVVTVAQMYIKCNKVTMH